MGSDLVALGASLLVAGLLARGGRRIGLPTIPLFMVAGIVFGPNTPGIDFVDDPSDLALLATLGLVFLLFSLGLEFSVGELVSGGRRLLAIGAVYLTLNLGGGLALGFALGWGDREALVIAGAVGISSSAIVTKLLVELGRLANPETRVILGIIVVEDLFLALYLAVLEPVLSDSQGTTEILTSMATSFGFLLVLGIVARKLPQLVSRLVAADDDELLTVCFVGLVILVAGAAEELGVSDAIGAFMVGLILAESSVRGRIERLVIPLRDTFAAVFFFAFGLTIDPGDVAEVAGPVAIAVALSVILNLAAGLIAARWNGLSRTGAANVGFTILARGEFSLILASLAAVAGLDDRIGPFVAGYVLILALAAPLLAANSRALARLLPGGKAPTPRPPLPRPPRPVAGPNEGW
jgi:CPA2 family monovalent cation:H+ antiporter-2